MDMNLKRDAEGAVVVSNDCPVYVDGQGADIEINIKTLYKTISELKDEAKNHRLKAKKYKLSLDAFDGIEDFTKYRATADQALQKVADFADKDMIATDKVSELKAEWDKTAQIATQKMLDTVQAKQDEVTKKDKAIRQLLITNAFASSVFFAGKEPKTILRPDIAEAKFGKHCKIEENNAGFPDVVLYTTAGMPISSLTNPAENAKFDEGMSIILDQYEGKASILPPGIPGSGATGGTNTESLNAMTALKQQHAEALKSGNIANAIMLKNKMHAEMLK